MSANAFMPAPLMGNDFKELRERGYAAESIATLAANGARVGA